MPDKLIRLNTNSIKIHQISNKFKKLQTIENEILNFPNFLLISNISQPL